MKVMLTDDDAHHPHMTCVVPVSIFPVPSGSVGGGSSGCSIITVYDTIVHSVHHDACHPESHDASVVSTRNCPGEASKNLP